MTVPSDVLREAFSISGERWPVRIAYASLAPRRWPIAYVGFSYARGVDDLVDCESDEAKARSLVLDYLESLRRSYAQPRDEPARAWESANGSRDKIERVERLGAWLFDWDAAHGCELRAPLETLLDLSLFDIDRRFKLVPRRELNRYARKLGESCVSYLAILLHPSVPLSRRLFGRVGRAYIRADSLMDLNEDLGRGIVNVPAEDIRRFEIDLQAEKPGLERWIPGEARQVRRLFKVALEEASRVELTPLRRLLVLHLTRKRFSMERHLRNGPLVRTRPSAVDRFGQDPEVFAGAAAPQSYALSSLEVGAR